MRTDVPSDAWVAVSVLGFTTFVPVYIETHGPKVGRVRLKVKAKLGSRWRRVGDVVQVPAWAIARKLPKGAAVLDRLGRVVVRRTKGAGR